MLIPDDVLMSHDIGIKGGLYLGLSPGDGPASYQVVGEVMAHQAYDG